VAPFFLDHPVYSLLQLLLIFVQPNKFVTQITVTFGGVV